MGELSKSPVSRLMSWITAFINKTETLLVPTRLNCITCGASYAGHPQLPLCKACEQAIPWILQVKCSHCGRPGDCPDCVRRPQPYIEQNRSAVSYSPQMKEWLALYKYRGHEKLRGLIGTMLLHAYHLHKQASAPAIATTAAGTALYEYITYVPLSDMRLAERGFNQAQQMAEELGKRTGLPVLPTLERVRHTDKQSFKTRGDRLEDLHGVFRFLPESMWRLGAHAAQVESEIRLYLVDDVYTTGSTLNECARTMMTSGIPMKIYGICWAR